MDFERSVSYERIAEELIEEEKLLVQLKADDVKVICVISEKAKLDESKRRVYAEIEKIPPKFKWATDADAMITVYYNNIVSFSEAKRRIVILRELLKLSVDGSGENRKVCIRDYDLKDFRCIIDRYGPNWDQERTLFDED